MKVNALVENGILISPVSGRNLKFSLDNNTLSTEDKSENYTCINGVPILLKDKQFMEKYAGDSNVMNAHYSEEHLKKEGNGFKGWLVKIFEKDYRNIKAIDAFENSIRNVSATNVALAIGGGRTGDLKN